MKSLQPEIWGPRYWFFLRTIAILYPKYPNTNTKKKYYDFFHNQLPLFIPNDEIVDDYYKLLNLYPLSPYLSDNESLCRWVWFMNNKINEKLGKPKVPLDAFYTNYYELYKESKVKIKEKYKLYKKLFYFGIVLLFLVFIKGVYIVG